jgi:hypothetical protein
VVLQVAARRAANSSTGQDHGVACGLGAWRTIVIAIPVALALLFATRLIDWLTNRNK